LEIGASRCTIFPTLSKLTYNLEISYLMVVYLLFCSSLHMFSCYFSFSELFYISKLAGGSLDFFFVIAFLRSFLIWFDFLFIISRLYSSIHSVIKMTMVTYSILFKLILDVVCKFLVSVSGFETCLDKGKLVGRLKKRDIERRTNGIRDWFFEAVCQ
jgi:hypothetical protein